MKKSLIVTLALVFVLGIAGTAFANPYSDVPAGHWAYKAVNDLTKAGVVEGYQGKYHGNDNMTRYEMAAITARAMAKADKADAATKATIDKLAVEFSKELNDLGMRVAKLEKSQSGVKFTGDARIRWIDADKSTGDTDFGQRVRMYFTAPVNEKTTFNGKMVYTNAGHTNFGDDDKEFYLYEANAVHKNFLKSDITLKFGRMSQEVGTMGYFLSSTGAFDGVEAVIPAGQLTFTAVFADAGRLGKTASSVETPAHNGGTKIKGSEYWGLNGTDSNIAIGKIDYKASKDLAFKGWYLETASTDKNAWGVGLNYAIDKNWNVLADYIREDHVFDTFDDLHVRLAYKGANRNVAGSWGAFAEYVKWEGTQLESAAATGIGANVKQYTVSYSNALAKNVVFEGFYSFDRKDAISGADLAAEDYTRFQINYFF